VIELELLLEQLSDVHAAHRTVLVLASFHHYVLEPFFDLQPDFLFFILHFIK
jgi:hypothetical protein